MTLAELRPVIQQNLDQMQASNERYALRPEHSPYLVAQTRQHIRMVRELIVQCEWVVSESLRDMQRQLDESREELGNYEGTQMEGTLTWECPDTGKIMNAWGQFFFELDLKANKWVANHIVYKGDTDEVDYEVRGEWS